MNWLITLGDIRHCPKKSMLPGHYRTDGSCKCGQRQQAKDRLAELEVRRRTLDEQIRQAREEVRRS